ncbi:major capsid protein [Pedobacter metabolipauper]|uniref:Major capsid protein E n=1 Tax=Pedobacter metabolipauper TaxID=425513 RepID=A0A4R6T187_9SPHI|nr:major capsid protein [Pedobacter metabolipauper]TDQ12167.1 major capsid protein E [Pedobacter metabolipauper]
MADQLKSIFGNYTENMSVVAVALEKAKVQPLYTRFLDWATPTVGLDFSTVIGKERLASMASVVDIDANHPLRSRSAAYKVEGEVPSIKVKRGLTQKQYRNYKMLQSIKTMSDAEKAKAITKYILDDMKYVSDAVKFRINYMFLQMLSTGGLEITADNNPDGIVTGLVPVGFLADNIITSALPLSDVNSKIITYIKEVVELAKANGDEISSIMVSRVLWNRIKVNKEFLDEMKGYFNPGSNARAVFTMANMNMYMVDNDLPPFEIVDAISRTEEDGKQKLLKPFSDTTLVFIPAGKLGIIHNAFAIEEMEPNDNVEYTTVERILIAKWHERSPWGEFTSGEVIALPGLEAVESIYHLRVGAA